MVNIELIYQPRIHFRNKANRRSIPMSITLDHKTWKQGQQQFTKVGSANLPDGITPGLPGSALNAQACQAM